MQATQFGVEALTNHLAATHNHSSDERIGTDPPASTLRKLQRPREMAPIRACELRIPRTD
jgi:hypothetical protein